MQGCIFIEIIWHSGYLHQHIWCIFFQGGSYVRGVLQRWKLKTPRSCAKRGKREGYLSLRSPPPPSNEARQLQANSSTLLSAPCWKKQRRPAPKHSMCLVLVMVLLLVYTVFSTRAVFRLSLNQQTIGIRFKFSYTDVRGVSRLSSNSWPESK